MKHNGQEMVHGVVSSLTGKKVSNDKKVGSCGGSFKKGENSRPTSG